MFEAFESGTQSELGWSPPSLAGHDSEANETDPRAARTPLQLAQRPLKNANCPKNTETIHKMTCIFLSRCPNTL